jgi:thymidylate kinase
VELRGAELTTPAFIVVEGLVGSGKSTVTAALADVLRAERLELVADAFRPAAALLDDDPAAIDAHYALFMSMILYRGRHVERILGSGQTCIADSWVYRTQLTHRVLGASIEVSIPSWLPRPTHVFWLEVDETVRQGRVTTRARPSTLWKDELESHSSALANAYRKDVPGLVTIDADRSVSEVIGQIRGHLEQ